MRIRTEVWLGEKSSQVHPLTRGRFWLNLPVGATIDLHSSETFWQLGFVWNKGCLKALGKACRMWFHLGRPLEMEKISSHLRMFRSQCSQSSEWGTAQPVAAQVSSQTFTQTGFVFCFTPASKGILEKSMDLTQCSTLLSVSSPLGVAECCFSVQMCSPTCEEQQSEKYQCKVRLCPSPG